MPFQKNVFIHFECGAFLTIVEYERLKATMWETPLLRDKITEIDVDALAFPWNRIN